MKRICIAAIIAALSLMTLLVDASAENEKPAAGKLAIGDDINAARKVLDAFDKPHGGHFQISSSEEDGDHVSATLDHDKMSLCIWFSKSKRTITGFSAVCTNSRRDGRASQVWLPVTEVQLNRDSTHTLTFAKPLTLAELEAKEKAEDARSPDPTVSPFCCDP